MENPWNKKKFAEIFCEARLIFKKYIAKPSSTYCSFILKKDLLIHKQWGLGLYVNAF
jgi:hypothetical protein